MIRNLYKLFVLIALASLSAPACRAGLVISYADLQVDSAGVGSFEVVITNTESPGGPATTSRPSRTRSPRRPGQA